MKDLMSIPLLIIVSIIGYILSLYITVRYMIQDVEPPKAVRAAGMAEAAFGTMTWGLVRFCDNNVLIILVFLFGIFWIGVAVSLYKASKVGRTICLVLSILRIPTVIGILFSVFSVYKLYFTQESNDFFNRIGQKGGEHSNSNDSAVPSREDKN